MQVEDQTMEEKLMLVHAIFRHGDRTIDESAVYPNDPYKDEIYYPFGKGELTNEGKMTGYRLGKYLRSRYNDFLGPYYTPEALEARSSGYNRTKMTLQLVLAGLFPPVGAQIWNEALPWQPIPYDYLPKPQDELLFGIASQNFQKYYIEYFQSEEVQAVDEKHQDLYKYLTKHSGMEVTDIFSTLLIYAALKSQSEWGFELPDWTKTVFPEKLEPFSLLGVHSFSATAELKKIIAGPLLRKIVEDTQQRKKGRKLFLYSAHDSNIVAMLGSLGLYDPPHLPPFGSCIIFEVVEVKKELMVKVLYKKDPSSPTELLKLPGCDELCPLNEFEAIAQKYFPEDKLKL